MGTLGSVVLSSSYIACFELHDTGIIIIIFIIADNNNRITVIALPPSTMRPQLWEELEIRGKMRGIAHTSTNTMCTYARERMQNIFMYAVFVYRYTYVIFFV